MLAALSVSDGSELSVNMGDPLWKKPSAHGIGEKSEPDDVRPLAFAALFVRMLLPETMLCWPLLDAWDPGAVTEKCSTLRTILPKTNSSQMKE